MGAIAGGLIGQAASSGDISADTAARQAALQQYLNITAPTTAQEQLALQQEQVAGSLNPNMVGAQQNAASGLNAYQNNAATTQAQMNTLSQLGSLSQGGLNDQDRAALTQILNQSAGQSQAAQAATMQNMASRGMAGGGAELAARLSASQAAANQGAQAGLGVASQSQARANQALTQQGQLAQSMQSQAYNQAANTSAQQNAINQFNTNLRQQAANTNTAAANQAQLFNLQNQQNVANTNTGISNQQQIHNQGLAQQNFQNQMGIAGGIAGQQNQMANYYGQQAQNTAAMWSGMGQGFDQGMTAGIVGGSSTASPSGGLNSEGTTQGYASTDTPDMQGVSGGGSGVGVLAPSQVPAFGGAYGGKVGKHGIKAPGHQNPIFYGKGYSDGGKVDSEDSHVGRLQAFVKGATKSGWQPDEWKKNISPTPEHTYTVPEKSEEDAEKEDRASDDLASTWVRDPRTTLYGPPSPGNPMSKYTEGGIVTTNQEIPHYALGGMVGSLLPMLMMMNKGGQVPERTSPQSLAQKYGPLLQHLKSGGQVEGKAEVKGDSPKNDTIHAMLSPDEIVVPRSHTGNVEKAKDYLDGLFSAMGKQHGKPAEAPKYKVSGGVKYMRGPNGEAIKVK